MARLRQVVGATGGGAISKSKEQPARPYTKAVCTVDLLPAAHRCTYVPPVVRQVQNLECTQPAAQRRRQWRAAAAQGVRCQPQRGQTDERRPVAWYGAGHQVIGQVNVRQAGSRGGGWVPVW